MRVYEILKEIRETKGTKAKKAVLEKYKDHSALRRVLRLAYDPYIHFGISKDQLKKWKARSGRMELEYVIFGELNKDVILAVYAALDDEDREVLLGIVDKNLRLGLAAKGINAVFGEGFVPEFGVQLANTYDPSKAYAPAYWLASFKMDGIRGVFDITPKGCTLLSRSGKPIVGYDHLCDAFYRTYLALGLKQPVRIDGEFYRHNTPFENIQGEVLSKDKMWKETPFCVFAVYTKATTAEQMLPLLATWSEGMKDIEQVIFIEHWKIENDRDEILRQAEEAVKAHGFEGIMLRDPSARIENKRSDSLLKVKPFKSADLVITDMIEGKGKYAGKLGALVCTGEVEGTSIEVEVGSGFTDEQREEFWKHKKWYIGHVVEIKYQNASKKSIRFPVFMRLRLDKEE